MTEKSINRSPYKPLTTFFVLCAVVLYCCSIFLPALKCADREPLMGYLLLIFGWQGLTDLDFRWLGNLTFIFLVVRYAIAPKATPVMAILTIFAAMFSFMPAAACTNGEILMRDSIGLGAGGYMWVISLVMVGLTNLRIQKQHHVETLEEDSNGPSA